MPKKKCHIEQFLLPVVNIDQSVNIEDSIIFNKVFLKKKINFYPRYCRKNGLLYEGDSLDFLKHIPSSSIDVVFADPPYNIKKDYWDIFESQNEYILWSMQWISEASRVLKENGSLFICGFTENLADIKYPAMRYFKGCRWLIWHYKNKANLGLDWGRSHESILLLRKSKNFTMNIDDIRIPYNSHTLKYPGRCQADSSQYGNSRIDKYKKVWIPNPLGAKPKDVIEIPTTCNGMEEKTRHPTQKPEELMRKLILSASNPGEVILDPFSGSGTTLVVAEQLKRYWIGCELNAEYNNWAIHRIDNVVHKTIQDWIDFDRENTKRRMSIR